MPQRSKAKKKEVKRDDATRSKVVVAHEASPLNITEASTVMFDLEMSLDKLENLLTCSKGAVLKMHEKDSAPSNTEELYGAYASQKGILVSRVLQGTSTVFDNEAFCENTCQHEAGAESSSAATSSSQQRLDPRSSGGVESVSAPDVHENDSMLTEIQNAFNLHQDSISKPSSVGNATLSQRLQELLVSSNPSSSGLRTQQATKQPRPEYNRQAQIVPKEPAAPPKRRSINLASYDLEPVPETYRVAIVSGEANFYSGVLPLPSTDCMLFDETSRRARISDSKAEGGMLVCRGRGCMVSFRNVHFEGCPVIILEGAVVTFDHCTFCESKSKRKGTHPCFAVFAHGNGTMVSLSDCAFAKPSRHLKDACVAQKGARMHLNHCTFGPFLRSAVRVTGDQSRVTCFQCVIGDRLTIESLPEIYAEDKCTGVCVSSHARVSLLGCFLLALSTGIWVSGATVDLTNAMIVDSMHQGVEVHADSTVSATRCFVQGCRNEQDGFGMYVDGGSTLSVFGCLLLENASGIVALDHANVTIRNCEASHHTKYCVVAAGSEVTVSVSDTVCKVGSEGVHVESCIESTVEHVTCSETHIGFCIASVQSCNMSDCSSSKYTENGVGVSGNCGPVSIRNCTINSGTETDENQGCVVGLQVKDNVAVYAEGCTIRPGTKACGSHVSGSSAKLTLRNCSISSACVGVQATLGGTLKMTGCSTTRCTDLGVALLIRASGSITNHTSRADGIGLQCIESVVHADSCEFLEFIKGAGFVGPSNSESSMHGCRFVGSGGTMKETFGIVVKTGNMSVAVSKCSVKGATAASVFVGDTSGLVKLHDCVFSESKGNGLEVIDPDASVSVKGCTFKLNAGMGMFCKSGSRIVAERVHTMRNGACGYGLVEGASMKLTDCSSFQDSIGVKAMWREEKGTDPPILVMRRALIRFSSITGISICAGVKANIVNTCVLQSGGSGFDFLGATKDPRAGKAKATDCRVEACCGQGVSCLSGGQVTLRNVLAVGNCGAGFNCSDSGSFMKVIGCKCSGNGETFVSSGGAVIQGVEEFTLPRRRI